MVLSNKFYSLSYSLCEPSLKARGFFHILDYGKLIDEHHTTSLEGFARLTINQESKITDLVATGSKLSRTGIETFLKDLVAKQFKRVVFYRVERFPGVSSTWKISSDPEGTYRSTMLDDLLNNIYINIKLSDESKLIVNRSGKPLSA